MWWKELSFCHKLWFSYPYIFAFQYLTSSGCKDTSIVKSEFVAKLSSINTNLLFSEKVFNLLMNSILLLYSYLEVSNCSAELFLVLPQPLLPGLLPNLLLPTMFQGIVNEILKVKIQTLNFKLLSDNRFWHKLKFCNFYINATWFYQTEFIVWNI